MSRDLTKYPALQAWNAHAEQLTAELSELQSIGNTAGDSLDYRILEQTLHAKVAVIKGLASQVPEKLDAARVDQLRAWDQDLTAKA